MSAHNEMYPPTYGGPNSATKSYSAAEFDDVANALAKTAAERDALKAQLAEARAKAEKEGDYAQRTTDHVCHYRNLAIILGAKPSDMVDSYDRELCVAGISTRSDSLLDCAEAWDVAEKASADLAAREAELERVRKALQPFVTWADKWYPDVRAAAEYRATDQYKAAVAALSPASPTEALDELLLKVVQLARITEMDSPDIIAQARGSR